MVLISFEQLQKIHIFWKFGGCSSKTKPATPISILCYQRAWQTFSMSYTLQIFKNDSFFIDEQMILLSFFDNPNQNSTIYNLRKTKFLIQLYSGEIFTIELLLVHYSAFWAHFIVYVYEVKCAQKVEYGIIKNSMVK